MIIQYPRDTCFWNLTGTETFRRSSTKLMKNKFTKFPGWGGNMQNKSIFIKEIYCADEGKKFVKADQSGAEALIFSYLCRDGKFRSLFKNNIKPHTYTAINLFKEYWYSCGFDMQTILNTEIPKLKELEQFNKLSYLIKTKHDKDSDKPYYYIGKKTVHSADYKMMANTFVTDVLKESNGLIRLKTSEAEKFLNEHHKMFPEIKLCQIDIEQQLSRTRILRNLQGFPRKFTGVWSDALIREGIAFIPQSTVGIITANAIIELHSFIQQQNLDWDIMNDEHDSVMLQCPVSEEYICAAKLKSSLEQTLISPRSEQFKMKSEVMSGFNWGKHSEKNPEGLKTLDI